MNFPGNYLPAIIALCKRHKVKKLFAFGSVLTNRFNEQSDIDLVVDFDKTNVDDYFSNFFDLKYALESLFESEVALREAQALHTLSIKENIDTTKMLIYG